MTGRAKGVPSELDSEWRHACENLVFSHYEKIYGFLAHLSRDQDLARDLTQETFAAAWSARDVFEGRSEQGTWLRRIAYTKFIDSRRREARDRRATMRTGDAPGPGHGGGPLEGLLVDERARQVRGAIAALTDPADRAVIVLHYLDGLSFRQMADILGEPAGTAKWRTSRALGRLRILIREEGE